MAVLLQIQSESAERARVYGVHYKPETLSAAQVAAGVLLDKEPAVPANEEIPAYTNPVLYVNPTTKATWWEYEARDKTQEETLAELSAKLDAAAADIKKILEMIGKVG